MILEDILIEPILTEKATTLREEGKYVFKVHPDANKLEIKQAITNNFSIDGWQHGTTGAHNYIDVFKKTYYRQRQPSINVTVTVAEDDNNDGRSIRLYVCIRFAQQFEWANAQEFQNWLFEGFENAHQDPDGIPERFNREWRDLPGNARQSGLVIHEILQDSDWEQWTAETLNDNVAILRDCCTGLCAWADAYVATLPSTLRIP